MPIIKMKVEGMSCGLCAINIEGALNDIGCNGKVDLSSALLAVEYDEKNLSLEKIRQVVEEWGYQVFPIE